MSRFYATIKLLLAIVGRSVMTAQLCGRKSGAVALAAFILPACILISAGLTGCSPSPKSMFEQQAEEQTKDQSKEQKKEQKKEQNEEPAFDNQDPMQALDKEPLSDIANQSVSPLSAVTIYRRQAIARQPNCDDAAADCQYLELNTLSFDPDLPWLTHILWPNLARLLDPTMPLVAEEDSAKKAILKLFNQIAYGDQVVATRPLFQRLDTDLVINPTSKQGVSTGYLKLGLSQQRSGRLHEKERLIMLDLTKELQLNLKDVLEPNIDQSELLAKFVPAKLNWLSDHGIDAKGLAAWPVDTDQWYLDENGLHLLFSAEDLSAITLTSISTAQSADLTVPFSNLNGIIKPEFIISSFDATTFSTTPFNNAP